MPRKKSVKRSAKEFKDMVSELEKYVSAVASAHLGAQYETWAHEAALIKLAAGFENLMRHALVGAVNNDTTVLTERTGIQFPRHLTDEVCEYIVTGGGYFDFRGREGLIAKVRDFVPATHYLATVLKKQAHKSALEQLIALRNFAAHESPQSKRAARTAVSTNLSAAGAWLKRQNRFGALSGSLRKLADDIEAGAPY